MDYDHRHEAKDYDYRHEAKDYDHRHEAKDYDHRHEAKDYDHRHEAKDYDHRHEAKDYDHRHEAKDYDHRHEAKDYDHRHEAKDYDRGHEAKDYDHRHEAKDYDYRHEAKDYDHRHEAKDYNKTGRGTKRKWHTAFGANNNSHSNIISATHNAKALVISNKARKKRRTVDPQVSKLLQKSIDFPAEKTVLRFGESVPGESYRSEYKCTLFQDYKGLWRLLKSELPRNLSASLNCAAGQFNLYFGIADNGKVVGVWLNADQRQRLSETINSLLKEKLSKFIMPGDDYSLKFLRVDPEKLGPKVDHRLYVLHFSCSAQNPKTIEQFVSCRSCLNAPTESWVTFLRVGCAQVQRLTTQNVLDVIANRQKM